MTPDSEKIPIAYVITNFYQGGGTENQLAMLVNNLDPDKFIPYVFNFYPRWENYIVNADCEVIYLNINKIFSFKFIRSLFTLRKHFKQKKIKIAQVYFIESRVLGTLAAKLAGIKKIVFCRREMGWWYTPKKLKVIRAMARLSQNCLVNAKTIKKMVTETEKFPADKIDVIYNGVEFKPNPNAKQVSKSDFGIPKSSPVIGMVGNLRPVKRPDRFLRAASMMKNKDVHFLLVGEGPLENDLKNQAKELGIEDRVHFYYTVDGIYHVLKMLDIGVLTSESEGLSNVLIEYAFAGLPAVAFDVGGNGEVIINNETGFVLPDGDETALADKLDYLLANKDEAEQFGQRASLYAQNEFSVDSMVKKTEDFYIRILNE